MPKDSGLFGIFGVLIPDPLGRVFVVDGLEGNFGRLGTGLGLPLMGLLGPLCWDFIPV